MQSKILLENNELDYLVYRQGSGTTIEIYDINVGSDRRVGKGRKLINTLIDHHLPKGTTLVWAITRSTNLVAQQFYEEMGFRVVAVLRRFYQHDRETGADAIMFGRDINQE